MNWYCLHTRPQKEAVVAEQIATSLGLEVYLPRLRFKKTIRRVKKTVVRPLFPRYLFCRLELANHYRTIRYAKEVCDIVHFGRGPAVVDPGIIEQLRNWAGEQNDLIDSPPALAPGHKVEFTEGPMRGLQAIVTHAMSDSERIKVLLSVLESQVHVVVPRHQITLVRQ